MSREDYNDLCSSIKRIHEYLQKTIKSDNIKEYASGLEKLLNGGRITNDHKQRLTRNGIILGKVVFCTYISIVFVSSQGKFYLYLILLSHRLNDDEAKAQTTKQELLVLTLWNSMVLYTQRKTIVVSTPGLWPWRMSK